MEEVAFGPDLAVSEQGAVLTFSHEPERSPRSGAGYQYDWRDGRVFPMTSYRWRGTGPVWLKVAWDRPQTLTDVVLRMPVLILVPPEQRTIGRLTLELREHGADGWRTIARAQWRVPAQRDGSEVRSWTVPSVSVTALRVVFEAGNPDGDCFIEGIEAYGRAVPSPPLTVTAGDLDPDLVLEPGDKYPVTFSVTDRCGLAVAGHPVPCGSRTDWSGRAICSTPAAPTVSRGEALAAALGWLERVARRLIGGSRLTAVDGTTMYTPDGVGSYEGFWVRDFQYMVEGCPEGVSLADIERAFDYLIGRQREDGAMPNKVLRNGRPVYCPGLGCDSVFGPAPPPDNPPFMVKLAAHHARLSGSSALLGRSRDQLARGMEFVPRSAETGLVHIPPQAPSSPYGFTDAIAKTGDQLFDSLLFHEAAILLAEAFALTGEPHPARRWRGEAARVAASLQSLYDEPSGMFLAASVDCRQIDIWGSAYAARIGVAGEDQQRRIARYLVDNYDGVVCRGYVRHTAPGEYWQRTLVPNRDVYQDGPYWAIPSGWVAEAIATLDRDLAERMLIDLVKEFQRNGVNEAIHPAFEYVAIPNYVASATNALPALRALVAEP